MRQKERHVGPSAVLIRSLHPAHVPGRLAVVVQTPDPLTKRFSTISTNKINVLYTHHPAVRPSMGHKEGMASIPNCLHRGRLSRISSDGSIAPPPPAPSNERATRRQIGSVLCTRPIALQYESSSELRIFLHSGPPLTGGANRRHPVSPARGATVSVGLDPWSPPLQAEKQRSLVPTRDEMLGPGPFPRAHAPRSWLVDGAIPSDKLCRTLQVTDFIKPLPHPPVERLPAADCRRCW
ncbi:uncharacterized protein BO96DRAFT_334698 [Aspergillus niger CBS 101883]|uniref:uncharacterized protein n=1 Tax=Aspergillus lacticoffeatus (strain CBS 101883) TaxID=1450533 RepID=UPI000D7FDB0F|nr:uncharacterized protein BO96DRAFT_334698 [Aspergillus niger CBS 101883]PYH57790.1 hypothetical protein BO96DRAFT_334698 [Aspergillus niger CBS 101883]